MKKVIFIALIVGGIASAGTFLYFGYVDLKNLKPGFKNIQYLGYDLTKEAIGIRVMLKLDNPSNIGFTVTGYKLDVYLDDKFIAPFASNVKQVVKADSTSGFDLDVYISPGNILSEFNITDLSSLATKLSSLNMGALKSKHIIVKGYVSISVLGLSIYNYPVNLNEMIGDLTS